MGKKWLAVLVAVTLLLTSALASLSIRVGAITYGDVNRDGDVNMKDVLLLRKYIAGLPADIDMAAADVDGDGSVNMKDVLAIRKYVAQLTPAPNSGQTDPTTSTTAATSTNPTGAINPPAADGVIYDSDVTGTLTLTPGKTFSNADITAALNAYAAAHGVAERYVVTVTASSTPEDYIYPILIGANETEVWPDKNYDHSYYIGQNGTIYGSLLGSTFAEKNDVPAYLYLYAEGGNATVTLTHVKIEAVSGTAATTASTTAATTTSTTKSTNSTTKSTTSTTSTTKSTTQTTTTTNTPPTDDTVIYDADVTGTLTLTPGKAFTSDAITAALQAETAAHGVAKRYIVTVTASATPEDYIYPILLGESAEVWPDNNYDHSYMIGQNGTTYGTLLGSKFTSAGDAPTTLYFYAEGGNATVTLRHVKIEVVRGGSSGSTSSTTKSSTSSTTKSTTSTTKSTTSTTKSTTTTTKTTPTADTVIYDADVTGTLTLTPGKAFTSDAITAALQAETAAHGVAERYIVTVTASATPEDYIYPILIGAGGTEVWPDNNYDHSYMIGQNGTTYGTLLGSKFTSAGDAPATLYFYAEGGNATVTLRHVKIEVVRGGGSSGSTSSMTKSTTKSTGSTTRSTTRTTTTVNDGHPHLNYNTSTDYGSMGVWWWYNSTATNTANRDARLQFLQSNHVTEIYLWANGMSNSQIATFIRAAAGYGMRVAWLSGDVAWLNGSGFDGFYNQYAAYQSQAAADAKFYAMHLDVEPHQWGNTQENWQKYADLVVRAGNKAHNDGYKIEWDIPYWLEGKTVTSGGSQVNLLTLLARSSDTLCLMSYRDTANGILSAGAEEMPLGTSCNCKIVLGVETYSEEGDSVSFMEEGKAVMYNALQSVLTSMSQKTTLGAGYGCAIHQIEVWYSLKD